MTSNIYSREQRLRKQADLQSRYGNLTNLRHREARYIRASAVVPELLINQINELRHEIQNIEQELVALDDETVQSTAHQYYWDGFAAELAENYDKAIKLYKNAARHAHPDASAAIRSVRYQLKNSRSKSNQTWLPRPTTRYRNSLLIGLGLILVLILIGLVALGNRDRSSSSRAVAATMTASSTPMVLIPPTATATPTRLQATPSPTPSPTPTALPPTVPPTATPTPSPTASPTAVPTLRPAPQIIEPKDGLVWHDGAIVFQFEKLDLAYHELYCLNTLRGYDEDNVENWSFPPISSKDPYIVIEANVFRIAKLQGMQCIVWSASIGAGNCDHTISRNTEERVIGLPRPCKFK